MNIDDAKSGSSRSVSWQTKAVSSEISHAGNKETEGSSEAGMKSSIIQPPAPRTPLVKLSGGSFEDFAITFSRSSPPHPEKHDHPDKKVKVKKMIFCG